MRTFLASSNGLASTPSKGLDALKGLAADAASSAATPMIFMDCRVDVGATVPAPDTSRSCLPVMAADAVRGMMSPGRKTGV